jgi:hypothetical protein
VLGERCRLDRRTADRDHQIASDLVPDWLPWTITGISAVALVAAIGWRVMPLVRRRLHFGE